MASLKYFSFLVLKPHNNSSSKIEKAYIFCLIYKIQIS